MGNTEPGTEPQEDENYFVVRSFLCESVAFFSETIHTGCEHALILLLAFSVDTPIRNHRFHNLLVFEFARLYGWCGWVLCSSGSHCPSSAF